MKIEISRQMLDCLIVKYKQSFVLAFSSVSMNQGKYMSAATDCQLARRKLSASFEKHNGYLESSIKYERTFRKRQRKMYAIAKDKRLKKTR